MWLCIKATDAPVWWFNYLLANKDEEKEVNLSALAKNDKLNWMGTHLCIFLVIASSGDFFPRDLG